MHPGRSSINRFRPNKRLKLPAPVVCGRIAFVIIRAWHRSLGAPRLRLDLSTSASLSFAPIMVGPTRRVLPLLIVGGPEHFLPAAAAGVGAAVALRLAISATRLRRYFRRLLERDVIAADVRAA